MYVGPDKTLKFHKVSKLWRAYAAFFVQISVFEIWHAASKRQALDIE